MVGCLFSPLPPMGVRKITSPPSCVKKRRTRKKNGGECVLALPSLALSAVGHSQNVYTLKVFKVFYI